MSRKLREIGARRCPICGRGADAKLKPFCSKSCADIDLARWLEGSYTIPAVDAEDGATGPVDEEEG